MTSDITTFFREEAAELAFLLRDIRVERDGVVVLDGIDLDIPARKVTALIGPSGSGKTSLLRLLNRLDEPTEGTLLYRSRPIQEYRVRELRLKAGFVFQTPVVFPGTVRDNLRQTAEIAGISSAAAEAAIARALQDAELDESLADRSGDRLSGGERQRVTIARALVSEPEVLLMDEPTSALDPEIADRLMDTVLRLARERGLTVVVATHRLIEARRASAFTVALERGRVLAAGPTPEVFGDQGNLRLHAFLRSGTG